MQTIGQVVGEYGMEAFRAEFEKIFYTLLRFHDNERRLMKKCRQLNEDIAYNVGRVNTVLKMTEEEQINNIQTKTVSR